MRICKWKIIFFCGTSFSLNAVFSPLWPYSLPQQSLDAALVLGKNTVRACELLGLSGATPAHVIGLIKPRSSRLLYGQRGLTRAAKKAGLLRCWCVTGAFAPFAGRLAEQSSSLCLHLSSPYLYKLQINILNNLDDMTR